MAKTYLIEKIPFLKFLDLFSDQATESVKGPAPNTNSANLSNYQLDGISSPSPSKNWFGNKLSSFNHWLTRRSYASDPLKDNEGFLHGEPFLEGDLIVSSTHQIHYRIYGNPNAKKAVIFNHGGPGGRSDIKSLRPYNPEDYKVVLWDQRGCGKSTPMAGTPAFICDKLSNNEMGPISCRSLPLGEVPENRALDLLQDMEKLRELVGVEKWDIVSGTSWGATLALLYGETFPHRFNQLLLRNIYLSQGYAWLYKEGGASKLFPKAWKKFIEPIPEEIFRERGNDFPKAYEYLFKDPTISREEKIKLAKAWNGWERALFNLSSEKQNAPSPSTPEEDRAELAETLVSVHYFANEPILRSGNQLLENAYKINNKVVVIYHGEEDHVCPIRMSRDLFCAIRKKTDCYSSNPFPLYLDHIYFFSMKKGGHWGGEPIIKRSAIDAVSLAYWWKGEAWPPPSDRLGP